jgi:hypothetical protein
LGTVTLAGNAASDSSGCCPSSNPAIFTECPVGVGTSDTKITGRVAYGPGAVLSTFDGFDWNIDFILAATY